MVVMVLVMFLCVIGLCDDCGLFLRMILGLFVIMRICGLVRCRLWLCARIALIFFLVLCCWWRCSLSLCFWFYMVCFIV